jgi:TolA-binding protein
MKHKKVSEIDKVQKEKHDLLRLFDRGSLKEKEFEKQLNEINNRINELNKIYLEKKANDSLKRNEDKKMAEDKTVKVNKTEKVKAPKVKVDKPKSRGPKIKKDTMASQIADALAMKSLKTPEAVAARVVEKKPELTKEKVIKFVKIIIAQTKKGKGRWKNYNWNEESYLLTLKPVEATE